MLDIWQIKNASLRTVELSKGLADELASDEYRQIARKVAGAQYRDFWEDMHQEMVCDMLAMGAERINPIYEAGSLKWVAIKILMTKRNNPRAFMNKYRPANEVIVESFSVVKSSGFSTSFPCGSVDIEIELIAMQDNPLMKNEGRVLKLLLEGNSISEIARQTDIPRPWIHRKITNAKNHLKQKFKK